MTIKEIAKITGYSIATVSYVMNGTKQVSEETAKKIFEAVAEYGFRPNLMAKGLRSVRSEIIGVLAEDMRAFFVPEIISAITEFAENNGYHLLLSDMHFLEKLLNHYEDTVLYRNKINEQIAFLESAQVDGIIYVGMHDRDLSGIIEKTNKPLVYAYCHTTDEFNYSVTYDNETISHNVIKYLYNNGHRRIAAITGPLDSLASAQRLAGYKKALEELSIEFDPSCVIGGDWEFDSGYKAARFLSQQQKLPSALFCFNDYMAAGALNAFADLGIDVPRQISLVGFDNKDFTAFLRPRMSTVEIPFANIGSQSAHLLDALIKGKSPDDYLTPISCALVERESVTHRR